MGDDSLFRVVEVESVFVNGPAGKLEARLHAGYSDYLFIICHPHPHFGGSMDDRIVLALSNLLNELGPTLFGLIFVVSEVQMVDLPAIEPKSPMPRLSLIGLQWNTLNIKL